jgi:hypothetical protein
MSPMIKSVLRDEFNFTARPENYVVTDSTDLTTQGRTRRLRPCMLASI